MEVWERIMIDILHPPLVIGLPNRKLIDLWLHILCHHSFNSKVFLISSFIYNLVSQRYKRINKDTNSYSILIGKLSNNSLKVNLTILYLTLLVATTSFRDTRGFRRKSFKFIPSSGNALKEFKWILKLN